MARRAIVVGNDRYDSDELVDLKFAVDDAFRMRSFLEGLRGDAAFEMVKMLREASDSDVFDALEEAAVGLGEGDLFLFYFAGHGIQQKGTKQHLLLCPKVKPSVLRSSATTNGSVPHSFLDEVASRGPFDCLFTFDACRNEILAGQRGNDDGIPSQADTGSLSSQPTSLSLRSPQHRALHPPQGGRPDRSASTLALVWATAKGAV